jgi:CheY-like chemotaxis protein
MMPLVSGLELISHARNGKLEPTPIIVFSAQQAKKKWFLKHLI